ncbi:MAG: fumarylacetoacetate hydrolase family protein [Betaproteobacteria bacterium]|nr:fumarylacetoacetate hydrolase family protein [Betaproteobacteria bacterium]
MKHAIDFRLTPVLPVAESNETFPVGRIYCVGRNYAEHAREMGHDPEREPPFFFMKPADAIVRNGATIPFPRVTRDLHHEIEMVVAIGKGGAEIPVEKALGHVYGYAVGLDMTRRDIQGEAKKMGRPWEMGKAFDNSAPCTAVKPVSMIGHPAKGAIWLKVNGKVTQKGDLSEMIWNVPDMISYLSKLITLRAGDLIMSGTPAGVGPVKPGDRLEGHVDGVGDLTVSYAK